MGLGGYSLAWVGFAEDDERKTVRPVARYGEAAPYLDEISVTWGDDALGRGPTGTAIRTGRVRLARDLVVEPGYEPWRATAARHHLASSLSLPLLKDDVAFGAFMVYAPEPDAFGDTETEILVELANDLAFGIRTLRERSERYRLASAIEQVAESVIITDADARITYVNPAFERVTGYTRDEVIGRNPRLLKSGLQTPSFYEAMWAALTNGVPWRADFVNRRKDGTLFTEEAVISPVRDSTGAITSYVAVKRDVTGERASEATRERQARERTLIARNLADLKAGPTPTATAELICQHVVRLEGLTVASLLYFTVDGPAMPLVVVRADGGPAPLRLLPARRSERLRERAEVGPWAETWIRRPWHPYDLLFRDLGVQANAFAPVRHGGVLVGLLIISSAGANATSKLTEHLPALFEYATVSGALLGTAVVGLTESGSVRHRIVKTIGEGRFHPVFQPIVDLESREAVGYEALTRFDSGQRPDLCFADAWAVGLGPDLEMATLAASVARRRGCPPAGGSISTPRRACWRCRPAERGSWPSDRPIVLEITEHEIIEDYEAVRAAVRALGHDVRLAVDDAGAGIANFGHIVELRPDFVKLDIGLVRDVNADLASPGDGRRPVPFSLTTGCRLLAEGVETEAEADALLGLKVDLGQGYLFGRPEPAERWIAGPAAV